MLHKEEAPAGFQDSEDLVKDVFDSTYGTEDQGGKDSVDAAIGEGEGFGKPLNQVDLPVMIPGLFQEVAVHEGVGFNSDDPQIRWKVA